MVTEDDNALIERMIAEGKSAIDIRAAVPNVSRTNIYLKITKFKKHGTVGRVQTKTLGRPRVMGEGVDKFLQGLLAAKPEMELEEMRRHLQDHMQLKVSMSTISRAISRAGIAPGRHERPRAPRARRTILPALPGVDASQEPNTTDNYSLSEMSPQAQTVEQLPLDRPLDLTPQPAWTQMQQHAMGQQQQQQQEQHHPSAHVLMHMHQGHNHMNNLHVLDPSLEQVYPSPSTYPAMYPDLASDTGGNHATRVTGSAPPLDVYRSPYAAPL